MQPQQILLTGTQNMQGFQNLQRLPQNTQLLQLPGGAYATINAQGQLQPVIVSQQQIPGYPFGPQGGQMPPQGLPTASQGMQLQGNQRLTGYNEAAQAMAQRLQQQQQQQTQQQPQAAALQAAAAVAAIQQQQQQRQQQQQFQQQQQLRQQQGLGPGGPPSHYPPSQQPPQAALQHPPAGAAAAAARPQSRPSPAAAAATPSPAPEQVGFTQEQLLTLKNQIMAFRLLKRNQVLDETQMSGIKPVALPPPALQKPKKKTKKEQAAAAPGMSAQQVRPVGYKMVNRFSLVCTFLQLASACVWARPVF